MGDPHCLRMLPIQTSSHRKPYCLGDLRQFRILALPPSSPFHPYIGPAGGRHFHDGIQGLGFRDKVSRDPYFKWKGRDKFKAGLREETGSGGCGQLRKEQRVGKKNLEKSGCMKKKKQEEQQSEYRAGGEGKEKGGERGKEREEQGVGQDEKDWGPPTHSERSGWKVVGEKLRGASSDPSPFPWVQCSGPQGCCLVRSSSLRFWKHL